VHDVSRFLLLYQVEIGPPALFESNSKRAEVPERSDDEICYASLIAENEQQAREMAIEETNRKFSKSGLASEKERQGSRVGRRRPRPHHRLRLPRGVTSAPISFIVSRPSRLFLPE